MKRKTNNLRSPAEIKNDNFRIYGAMEKEQHEINPIFLKSHYPKMEVKGQ